MSDATSPLQTIATSLQRERRRVGISASELARRAGVSKSTLSQLESGTGNPSVETLWALSTALGIQFSRLVDPAPQPVRLIRAGEGPTVFSEHAEYVATLLAACPPGARRDLYLIRSEPGRPRESAPHQPGTVEHVVLCSGGAVAGLTDETVELHPGDYLSYPGDLPHIFRALEPHTSAILLSEHV